MSTASNPDLMVENLKKRIGFETPPTITEIEKGMIRSYARAIGATDRCYFDEDYARRTRFGGLIAPPTFVSYFITGHIPEVFGPELPLARQLHSEDIVRSFKQIRAGDVITAFARYTDAFQKIGKEGPMIFQGADLILRNQRDERVAETRIVSISY